LPFSSLKIPILVYKSEGEVTNNKKAALEVL